MNCFIKPLLYALLALPLTILAQKTDDQAHTPTPYDEAFSKLHYYNYKLLTADDTAAIQLILARELNLGEDVVLRVSNIATSLTATHITFDQYFKGIQVFGAGAKVAVSKNNVLFRCIENVLPTYSTLYHPGGSLHAKNLLQPNYGDLEIKKENKVFYWTGELLMPGLYAEFVFGDNEFHNSIWRLDGTLEFEQDLSLYFEGPDSIVDVKIFMPDPITPISKAYGGIYIDINDANEAVLDPLRFTKQIQTNYDSGYFHLRSNFVRIAEHSNPVYPVVRSNTPVFDYSRSHYGFEQTNAYYHIMNYQAYLQSLGYSLVNYPISVDAQGLNNDDNSRFVSGFNPPRLIFGEGGVDDAEDADVIIHEYGHAISHSASPNTVSGNERRTLEEALGDYFAVSYTRDIYSFNKDYVFNWDGHNPFFDGRTVDNPNNLNYKSTSFGQLYQNTTLWNDAMFDIWDQLGKTYTDKLQIEALYGYFQNMTFSQAALLVIDADSALTGGGNNTLIIWQAFDARGILDWSSVEENNIPKPYSILNTITGKAQDVKLVWNSDDQANVNIKSLGGQGLGSLSILRGENEIFPEELPSGVYFIVIETKNAVYIEKIVLHN
jgi:hypothetical protein